MKHKQINSQMVVAIHDSISIIHHQFSTSPWRLLWNSILKKLEEDLQGPAVSIRRFVKKYDQT